MLGEEKGGWQEGEGKGKEVGDEKGKEEKLFSKFLLLEAENRIGCSLVEPLGEGLRAVSIVPSASTWFLGVFPKVHVEKLIPQLWGIESWQNTYLRSMAYGLGRQQIE